MVILVYKYTAKFIGVSVKSMHIANAYDFNITDYIVILQLIRSYVHIYGYIHTYYAPYIRTLIFRTTGPTL